MPKNQDEITEVLINVSSEQKSNKSLLIKIGVIFIGICVLCLVAFFGYSYIQGKEASKAIETGKTYLENKNYDEAIASFNKAIEVSSNNTEAYELKAQAALDKKDYPLAGETYESLYQITSDPSYLSKTDKDLSSNTSGNFSNAGKVVMLGQDTFITNYNGPTNMLWRFINTLHDKTADGSNFQMIYELDDETNGINDLQVYNGKLYLKAGGKFGSFDVASGTFHHISTIPADSIPISPRILGDKFYYIANKAGGQTAIYSENLDGSDAKLVSGTTR